MKKMTMMIALTLTLVLLLVGCASTAPSAQPTEAPTEAPAATDAPAALAYTLFKEGVLSVGTSPDYPPYESLENGKLVGFDIEMVESVAKSIGLSVEWVHMGFDTIIMSTQTGQVDCGVSGFTYSEDRAASIDFTEFYLKSAQVAVVRGDSDIQKAEDFAGKTVSAGLGTTGEAAAKEIEGATVIGNEDYQMAFEMLKGDQIDGVVCDLAVAQGYIDQAFGFRMIEPYLVDEENCIVVSKDNAGLTQALNVAIIAFKASPEYEALRTKHGLK